MHTKFSVLFAVIAVAVLLVGQGRFIASDRVSAVAPLSHADLDIKLQGRRDKHQILPNAAGPNLINDSDKNALQNKPAPGAQRAEVPSFTDVNDKNVGNLAVGFGENAPDNLTERSSGHHISGGGGFQAADQNNGSNLKDGGTKDGGRTESGSRRPGPGSSSELGRYGNRPDSARIRQEENAKPEGAKAAISFVKGHPKFNKAEPGQNFSAADIPVGLSEEQMKLRKKKPTVYIKNPYERSLKQVYLLTEQTGDLALTKAQAKTIHYYIDVIENAKDSEAKAYEQIKEILTPKQLQTINVYLSGRMKHDSGPKQEDTDPLAAALKAIGN